ncbi:hypothetical protein DL765_008858 [Monosporascus sp. GIB2]|nr:hypothetical protein DL765_008858 [Monosporascus sp. GIB2]
MGLLEGDARQERKWILAMLDRVTLAAECRIVAALVTRTRMANSLKSTDIRLVTGAADTGPGCKDQKRPLPGAVYDIGLSRLANAGAPSGSYLAEAALAFSAAPLPPPRRNGVLRPACQHGSGESVAPGAVVELDPPESGDEPQDTPSALPAVTQIGPTAPGTGGL